MFFVATKEENLRSLKLNKKLPDIIPTKQLGGRFSNLEDMMSFILKTTENENVELSAAKYENSEIGTYYIVFRWSNNTENLSVNGEASLLVFEGFDIDLDVKALYHTHPKSTGPSYNDAEISSKLNLPIYVLGLDGRVWETEKVLVLPGKEPFIKIKIGNMNSWRLDNRNPPYGTLINDINLIR